MSEKYIVMLKDHCEVMDRITDELLEVADALEDNRLNVELGNGRYLNPASTIRAKFDHIWDIWEWVMLEARSQ